jgi:hypothetical protein
MTDANTVDTPGVVASDTGLVATVCPPTCPLLDECRMPNAEERARPHSGFASATEAAVSSTSIIPAAARPGSIAEARHLVPQTVPDEHRTAGNTQALRSFRERRRTGQTDGPPTALGLQGLRIA